ncbi:MAG TPA: GyrI-like domain-containing protein, partial [Methanomicrobiales archaeon]|nr:GyrI-like domain-containing protein [Methanomicrobiales archaeon]
PYEACETTYRRLFAWIGEQGLSITGPIRETYLNDPREVQPDQILTEIMAPVA